MEFHGVAWIRDMVSNADVLQQQMLYKKRFINNYFGYLHDTLLLSSENFVSNKHVLMRHFCPQKLTPGLPICIRSLSTFKREKYALINWNNKFLIGIELIKE